MRLGGRPAAESPLRRWVVPRYSRAEVLDRLNRQVESGAPVIMFGAGIGLTARCAELGGADLIGVYSTAFYRMQGRPSLLAWLPYADANAEVARRAREILPVVRETPCIAGVGAHDPNRSMDAFIDEMLALGFSGITNEPFVGLYGPAFGAELEAAGLGFSREVALIELAHRKDVFTVAWVFTPDEARRMAQAGADVLGAIVGVTAGGLTGAVRTLTIAEATDAVQAMCVAAREVRPDILVLSHGGPFKDPETAGYSIEHSDAVGYAAGSSGERMPTEQAVIAATREYKALRRPVPVG
jgi:predicted TIM-barrel enzyme